MAKPRPKLTEKQRRFVEAYAACGGNGTEAARRAGYGGGDKALGVTAVRTLANARVAEAIAKQGQQATRAAVADAAELQAYLTSVVRSKAGKATVRDRIKAVEVLAKVLGLMVEKHRFEGDVKAHVVWLPDDGSEPKR